MPVGLSIDDFETLPVFCSSLHLYCVEAGGSFNALSHPVTLLHSSLLETEKYISEKTITDSTFREDLEVEIPGGAEGAEVVTRTEKLGLVTQDCKDDLTDLETLLREYLRLGTQGRATWERLGWGTYDIELVKTRLISDATSLGVLNLSIVKARISLEKKNKLVDVSKSLRGSDLDVVKSIIEEGADVNAKDSLGGTTLHWASEQGHEAIVRLLIAEGADVNVKDYLGVIVLHCASGKGHEAVVRLLIAEGTEINAKTNQGYTALLWASERGHEAVVRLLIAEGADINAKGAQGETALHSASNNGHEAIVCLLIAGGANFNAKDLQFTALQCASINGHKAIIHLPIAEGAGINAEGAKGFTALHCASGEGYEAIVRLMIAKGVNVNAKDGQGYTALRWASDREHEAVVRLLIEEGADINAKGTKDETVMHSASQNGHEAIVRLLIAEGADINAKDRLQYTALHCALHKGHEAIARLLVFNGATLPSSSKKGSLHCSSCKANIPQLQLSFHCNICQKGDYDLCQACVDSGIVCSPGHNMFKWTQIGDKMIKYTETEKIEIKPTNRILEGIKERIESESEGGHEAIQNRLIKDINQDAGSTKRSTEKLSWRSRLGFANG